MLFKVYEKFMHDLIFNIKKKIFGIREDKSLCKTVAIAYLLDCICIKFHAWINSNSGLLIILRKKIYLRK